MRFESGQELFLRIHKAFITCNLYVFIDRYPQVQSESLVAPGFAKIGNELHSLPAQRRKESHSWMYNFYCTIIAIHKFISHRNELYCYITRSLNPFTTPNNKTTTTTISMSNKSVPNWFFIELQWSNVRHRKGFMIVRLLLISLVFYCLMRI